MIYYFLTRNIKDLFINLYLPCAYSCKSSDVRNQVQGPLHHEYCARSSLSAISHCKLLQMGVIYHDSFAKQFLSEETCLEKLPLFC